MLPKKPELSTILLKPNLCLPNPGEIGTTTSFALMDALCSYLVENKVKKVIIADHTLKKVEDFAGHELLKLQDNYPAVKFVLANEQRYYIPQSLEGKVLKSTELLKLLSKVDLFINIPTAKHHSATQISLSIKNLMGVIWDRSVFHTELDIDQALGDLAEAVKPHINIVDCYHVLLNGGPTGPGPVINDNRIFVSSDILAVDSVVTSRYNFGGMSSSPDDIGHLYMAYENGVGEIDLNKMNIEKITI
ncbi:MAG: DUF362 domain-containing protein [Bacteroidales bacterium]|nr:DUF362 domain-containing protein [Bacteroidales bacterium]